MFGLTLPDSVALGSFFTAFAAAIVGLVRGSEQRKTKESGIPSAMGAVAVVDRQLQEDLVDAMKDVAAAIREATEAHKESVIDKIQETVNELKEKFDPPSHSPRRR